MLLLMIDIAAAHRFNLDRYGFDQGRFGHHGFGGLDLYRGWGDFSTDRLQTRFENTFDDLMTDYDTGLSEVEDFYSSDEYADVVDGVEHLVNKYDLFLSGVERSVERLDDIIAIANDDLDFYTELLADYESRDDLSDDWLDRIVMRLTRMQDRLTIRIDALTEKQTTLSDNLASYQTFSTDLSNYLSEIVSAGGGVTDSGDMVAEIISASTPIAAIAALTTPSTLLEETTCVDSLQSVATGTTLPEPATGILVALTSVALFALRRPTTR